MVAACGFLVWMGLCCERIKLLGHRDAIAACHAELALANPFHESNPGQDGLRSSERFKPEHRPDDAFDSTTIVRNDIVDIFNFPDLDRDVAFRIRWSSRALLPTLLSIGTVSGTSFCFIVLSKKRLAVAASHLAVNRNRRFFLACRPRGKCISTHRSL